MRCYLLQSNTAINTLPQDTLMVTLCSASNSRRLRSFHSSGLLRLNRKFGNLRTRRMKSSNLSSPTEHLLRTSPREGEGSPQWEHGDGSKLIRTFPLNINNIK